MELDPPTDSAQLWESVEDAIRKDTRAIGKRLAAAKKRLAAGKPVNVRDDDVVPHAERYFTPEVLEVVQSTQPPESVFEAAGDLLRTMSETYVLRQVAARAAALEDQHAQVIAHAGGDLDEAIEVHLGLGPGRYGSGDGRSPVELIAAGDVRAALALARTFRDS